MKWLRYGVAVGLLAGLGACSDMMGGGSHPARTAAVSQPTVAPEMVRQVQSKLHDSGYYKQGPIDGVWGLGTETAVRSYQQDHNLGSSGQLDVPTLQALNLTGGPQVTDNGTTTTTTRSTRTDTNPLPADNTATAPAR